MKNKKTLLTLVFGASLFSATSAHLARLASVFLLLFIGAITTAYGAVSLRTKSGILIGIDGIFVDGIEYNVDLTDGTCRSVYGNCEQFAFSFQTYNAAANAAQALLTQVFAPPLDYYDEHPELIYGCGWIGSMGESHCALMVPYDTYTAASGAEYLTLTSAINVNSIGTAMSGGNPDYVSSPVLYNIGTDWSIWNEGVFTVWHVTTSPVPEPETYAMLLAGLGLLSFTARRRKQSA